MNNTMVKLANNKTFQQLKKEQQDNIVALVKGYDDFVRNVSKKTQENFEELGLKFQKEMRRKQNWGTFFSIISLGSYPLMKGLVNGVIDAGTGLVQMAIQMAGNFQQIFQTDGRFGEDFGATAKEALADFLYMFADPITDMFEGVYRGFLSLGNIIDGDDQKFAIGTDMAKRYAESFKGSVYYLGDEKASGGRFADIPIFKAPDYKSPNNPIRLQPGSFEEDLSSHREEWTKEWSESVSNWGLNFKNKYSPKIAKFAGVGTLIGSQAEELGTDTIVHNFISDTMESVGRMVPSIVMAYSGLPQGAVSTISSAYFFSSSFGSSFSEALERGATMDEAYKYAYSIATIESLTEQIGGVEIGKVLPTGGYAKIISSMIEEGSEEVLSEIASAGIENIIGESVYGANEDIFSRGMYAFLTGFASGGIFAGAGNLIQSGSSLGKTNTLEKEVRKVYADANGDFDVAQKNITKIIDDTLQSYNTDSFIENQLIEEGKKTPETRLKAKMEVLENSPIAKTLIRYNKENGKFELTDFGKGLREDLPSYLEGKHKGKVLDRTNIAMTKEVDAGLIHDDSIEFTTLEQVNNEQDQTKKRFVQEVLENSRNIAFVNKTLNKDLGYLETNNGFIYIDYNLNTSEMMAKVSAHETTHKMKYTDLKAYNRLKKLILSKKVQQSLKDAGIEVLSEKEKMAYTREYMGQTNGDVEYTKELVEDEIIANFVEKIITNPKIISKIFNINPEIAKELNIASNGEIKGVGKDLKQISRLVSKYGKKAIQFKEGSLSDAVRRNIEKTTYIKVGDKYYKVSKELTGFFNSKVKGNLHASLDEIHYRNTLVGGFDLQPVEYSDFSKQEILKFFKLFETNFDGNNIKAIVENLLLEYDNMPEYKEIIGTKFTYLWNLFLKMPEVRQEMKTYVEGLIKEEMQKRLKEGAFEEESKIKGLYKVNDAKVFRKFFAYNYIIGDPRFISNVSLYDTRTYENEARDMYVFNDGQGGFIVAKDKSKISKAYRKENAKNFYTTMFDSGEVSSLFNTKQGFPQEIKNYIVNDLGIKLLYAINKKLLDTYRKWGFDVVRQDDYGYSNQAMSEWSNSYNNFILYNLEKAGIEPAFSKLKIKQKKIDDSNIEITEETIFSDESERVMKTFAYGKGRGYDIDGGFIKVIENSPYSPRKSNSIYDFYVDENQRRKGIGTKLLKYAINYYSGKLAGQFSSEQSVKIAWAEGFRNSELKTLDEALTRLKENSSVYLEKGFDEMNPIRRAKMKNSIKMRKMDSQGKVLTQEQQEFFKDSQVVDENGNLMVVYHGTVSGKFDVFDSSFANIENDYGKGFYFTNNEDDVYHNYQEDGPDLKNKIERMAERLVEEDETLSMEEAIEKVRLQLVKETNVYEVYLNIKNPYYVGEILIDYDSYMEEYNIEDYDNVDDYYLDVDALIEEDIESAVDAVGYNYDISDRDLEGVRQLLWEAYSNQYTSEDIKRKSFDFFEVYTDEGVANGEIVRTIIQALGYDGIIDYTVSEKWGESSNRQNKMFGVNDNTTHYIAFYPNQIKETTNKKPTSSNVIMKKINTANLNRGELQNGIKNDIEIEFLGEHLQKENQKYTKTSYKNIESSKSLLINSVDIKEIKKQTMGKKRTLVLENLEKDYANVIKKNYNHSELYNHVFNGVLQEIILELAYNFEENSFKNKEQVLENIEKSLARTIAYLDDTFRDNEVNKQDPTNPEGYQYTRLFYWGLRDLLNAKKQEEIKKVLKDRKLSPLFNLLDSLMKLDLSDNQSVLMFRASLKNFYESTTVKQVNSMALNTKGEYAHTIENVLKQNDMHIDNLSALYGEMNLIEEEGKKKKYKRKPGLLGDLKLFNQANISLYDMFAVGNIFGLFMENSTGNVMVKQIYEGQKKQLEVSNAFYKHYEENGFIKSNRKNIDNLEKEVSIITNLVDKDGNHIALPNSQVMYLRDVLRREIVRNRMIEYGYRGGEQSQHFKDGGFIWINGNTKDIRKAESNRRQAKIVNVISLFNEVNSIVQNDKFMNEYSNKNKTFFSKMYEFENARNKDIIGLELTNDSEVIKGLNPTQKEKLSENLGDIDLENIYVPMKTLGSSKSSSSAYFEINSVIDLGIDDGMVMGITDSNNPPLIDSINNIIPRYTRSVANYYGLYRVVNDLNILFNREITLEDGSKISLGEKTKAISPHIVPYFEKLLRDISGYGLRVDDTATITNKIFGTIKRNFFKASLGANMKVILTQFASAYTIATIYGDYKDSRSSFITKMFTNMFAKGSKTKAKYLIENSEIYQDRARNSTFEISEATDNAFNKSKWNDITEFLMSGVSLTDNMINRAFFITLVESGMSEEQALKITEEAIVRYQSSGLSISKNELLRTEQQVLRLFTLFLGEPMKVVSNIGESVKHLEIINRFKKNKESIENYFDEVLAKKEQVLESLEEDKKALEEEISLEKDKKKKKELEKELKKIEKEMSSQEERIKDEKQNNAIIKKQVKDVISKEKEARRLLGKRVSAMIQSLSWQAFLGVAFSMLRNKAGDKDEDEAVWAYLGKKFGWQLASEVIGYLPFARDVYNLIINKYDANVISEFDSINRLGLAIQNMITDISNGGEFDYGKHLRNVALYTGQMLGMPTRQIERFFTTPTNYFLENLNYSYRDSTGQRVASNKELEEAIRKGDEKLVETIINRKYESKKIVLTENVDKEIKRLAKNGAIVNPSGIPDTFTINEIEYKNDKDKFSSVYNNASFVIEKITLTSGYKKLDDNYKAKLIKAIFNYYHNLAKQEVSGVEIYSKERKYNLKQAYAYFKDRINYYYKLQQKEKREQKKGVK